MTPHLEEIFGKCLQNHEIIANKNNCVGFLQMVKKSLKKKVVTANQRRSTKDWWKD